MNITAEILRIARSLISRKVNERDNLEREFKDAIKDGDTVEFEYTKKDGSKKKREIVPVQVFKMKGRWAVKGYETKDSRKIQKLFYLDMIGDVSQEEEDEVADEGPIIFSGREGPRKTKRMLEKAIKDGREVKMPWAAFRDGRWVQLVKEGVPTKIARHKNRGYKASEKVWFGDYILSLHLIGTVAEVKRRDDEDIKRTEDKKLRAKEMLDQLLKEVPEIGKYWGSYSVSRQKNKIMATWLAMNKGDALRREMLMGTSSDTLDGPHGAMETSQMVDVKTYMDIRAGKPWDKNRVEFRTEQGEPYWVDDEGNRSRRGPGGYSRRRRW